MIDTYFYRSDFYVPTLMEVFGLETTSSMLLWKLLVILEEDVFFILNGMLIFLFNFLIVYPVAR